MARKKKCFINSLPIEVLMKILLLLSVDELIQLMGVCKLWFKLITSKHFSRAHVNHWRHDSVFEFVSSARGGGLGFAEQLLYLSLEFSSMEVVKAAIHDLHLEGCLNNTIKRFLNPKKTIQFMVLDSCEGLLLIVIKGYSFIDIKSRLIVCNPFTKSCRQLPEIRELHNLMGGIVDWCTWTITYDALAGRYKVFGMTKSTERGRCFIFDLEYENESVEIHSWKQLSIPLPLGYWMTSQSASENGKIHFLAKDGKPCPSEGFLVSIDVSKEEWKVSSFFTLPSGNITEANGAFHHIKSLNNQEFEHWVLVDFDNPRWVMHLRISMNNCPWYIDDWLLFSEPLVIGQDGTRLIVQFGWGNKLFVYDMNFQWWNALSLDSKLFNTPGRKESRKERRRASRHMLVHHIKSLASLK